MMADPNQVQVWKEENGAPTMKFAINSSVTYAVFATGKGDIYFNNFDYQHRVDKWTSDDSVSVPVMYADSSCCGLFVDVIDNLYCSSESPDQVVRRSLNSAINSSVIVAGNGTIGSAPDMLHGPRGIFVDTNLDLYVADAFNNRVQLFSHDQLLGIPVAGYGATGTIALSTPTDVILDGNGYLYIVEYYGHRVVASGPNGFRCIIACTGIAGSAANQLNLPGSVSFDSHGNLCVTDTANKRVQKFVLATNTCGESYS